MCMNILAACMSVQHVCAWFPGRQEKLTDPLGLELQMFMTRHVGAGNNPGPLKDQTLAATKSCLLMGAVCFPSRKSTEDR